MPYYLFIINLNLSLFANSLYLLLVEILQPINCILVSEEVPSISIVLSERRTNALKGSFVSKKSIHGNFYTHRPKRFKPTTWSFEKNNTKFNGAAILFKDGKIWHPYQSKIKSHEVNEVIFSGLAAELSKITEDKDLLKATSGFFKIGNECFGGRIIKA